MATGLHLFKNALFQLYCQVTDFPNFWMHPFSVLSYLTLYLFVILFEWKSLFSVT